MKEKAIIKVITNTKNKATIKILSAMRSYLTVRISFDVRIEKKEKIQLAINNMHATPVSSSIFDSSLNFDIFNEVRTIRQNPNKLDDVFKICCVLLFAIGLNSFN
jgi:hypothetical protein